ncbi:MAG: Fur family transcriptional regulator [Oscillospiraceae bacterium]|jgi:Fur family ferric uptake transcriptional regulator
MKPVKWPEGVKKTKQRACVLKILEGSESPMSAMEICNQAHSEDSPVWLSTVYRILEVFVRENVAIKTMAADGEMALYELNRNKHRHYAVCLGCHKIVEMDNCPMEEFIPRLRENNFRVLGHRVEMYGYCGDCSEKK